MDNSKIRSICRACLSEIGEFKSVFVSEDNSGYAIHLSEMIMACASVQITFGDGLPEQICLTCAEQTVNMYLFKLKCEDSDNILRERLGRSPLQEICDVREEKYAEYIEGKDCNRTELNKNIKSDITIDEPHVGDVIDKKIQVTFGLNETGNNGSNIDNSVLVCSNLSNKVEEHSEYIETKGSNGTDLNVTIKSEIVIDEYHLGDVINDKIQASFRLNDTENIVSDSGRSILGSNELCIKDFKCEFCYKTFNTQSLLNRHIKSHSAIKEFECDMCNKRFTYNYLLIRHKIIHAKKMEFGDFGNNDDFEDDTIIKKTETDLYPCRECSVPFNKKKEMEMHIKQDIKVNSNISCHVCTKKFSNQSNLTRHLRTHCKPHICSTCNKGFFKDEQLTNHMKVHSEVKWHICDICSKGFNQISRLKTHKRTHISRGPFLCSTCHRGFNNSSSLRQHMFSHSHIKPHLCSTCGHAFATKSNLSVHLRMHTGARPFVCPICGYGFITSSKLTVHKRIHSGEKPYECDICKKKFSASASLKYHKSMHTGAKPYVCKFCAKACSRSGDLTSHMRIHTGEKPYICDECGQAFRVSGGLKAHKKNHLQCTGIEGQAVMGVMETAALLNKLQ